MSEFIFPQIQSLLDFLLNSKVKNIFCEGTKVILSSRVQPNRETKYFGWDPTTGKWYFINYPENTPPTLALENWAVGHTWAPFIGDFNGDGKDDVVTWWPSSGSWQVALNDGTHLVPTQGPSGYNWLNSWAIGNKYVPFIGDFNGDGKDDILTWLPDTGTWQVALSDGKSFIPSLGGNGNYIWLNSWSAGKNYIPVIGDFNNDGVDDISVYNTLCNCWDFAIGLEDKFEPVDHVYPGNWIEEYPYSSDSKTINNAVNNTLSKTLNNDDKNNTLSIDSNNSDNSNISPENSSEDHTK